MSSSRSGGGTPSSTGYTKTIGNPDHPFKVLQELGGGMQARVFKVQRDNMIYAVKRVEQKKVLDDQTRLDNIEHLRRESEILTQLKHPKIVNLVEAHFESANVYLVMEYVSNGDLFDKIAEKKGFSEIEARYVFRQLLSALKYLHTQNVVHRDLKPENILVNREVCVSENDKEISYYDVKIADFGLSKIVKEDSLAKTHVGTPYYWAPEVIKASEFREQYRKERARRLRTQNLPPLQEADEENESTPRRGSPQSSEEGTAGGLTGRLETGPSFAERVGEYAYDDRVDLWSLGVVLYVMLMGFYPFNRRKAKPLPEQIKEGLSFEAITKAKKSRDLSESARRLISQLLRPEPQDRWSLAEVEQSPWFQESCGPGLPEHFAQEAEGPRAGSRFEPSMDAGGSPVVGGASAAGAGTADVGVQQPGASGGGGSKASSNGAGGGEATPDKVAAKAKATPDKTAAKNLLVQGDKSTPASMSTPALGGASKDKKPQAKASASKKNAGGEKAGENFEVAPHKKSSQIVTTGGGVPAEDVENNIPAVDKSISQASVESVHPLSTGAVADHNKQISSSTVNTVYHPATVNGAPVPVYNSVHQGGGPTLAAQAWGESSPTDLAGDLDSSPQVMVQPNNALVPVAVGGPIGAHDNRGGVPVGPVVASRQAWGPAGVVDQQGWSSTTTSADATWMTVSDARSPASPQTQRLFKELLYLQVQIAKSLEQAYLAYRGAELESHRRALRTSSMAMQPSAKASSFAKGTTTASGSSLPASASTAGMSSLPPATTTITQPSLLARLRLLGEQCFNVTSKLAWETVSGYHGTAHRVRTEVLPDIQTAIDSEAAEMAMEFLEIINGWVEEMRVRGHTIEAEYKSIQQGIHDLIEDTAALKQAAEQDVYMQRRLEKHPSSSSTGGGPRPQPALRDSPNSVIASPAGGGPVSVASSGKGPSGDHHARPVITRLSSNSGADSESTPDNLVLALPSDYQALYRKIEHDMTNDVNLNYIPDLLFYTPNVLPVLNEDELKTYERDMLDSSASSVVESCDEDTAGAPPDAPTPVENKDGGASNPDLLSSGTNGKKNSAAGGQATSSSGGVVKEPQQEKSAGAVVKKDSSKTSSSRESSSSSSSAPSSNAPQITTLANPSDVRIVSSTASRSSAATALALLRAITALRKVDEVLQRSTMFWTHLSLSTAQVRQMKDTLSTWVKHSASNEQLRRKFSERLAAYAAFWKELELSAKLYCDELRESSVRMFAYLRSFENKADTIQTVRSLLD